MNIIETAAQIDASPDRARIEAALLELYGTSDITQVRDETLETFVRWLLPALSPRTFGGRRRHDD